MMYDAGCSKLAVQVYNRIIWETDCKKMQKVLVKGSL